MSKGDFYVVGKSLPKVDGISLVTGKPRFVADIELPGMLYAKILTSPHPHARIVGIDTSKAEKLPGVASVLTHDNTPHTRYTTAGQGYPEPSPYDTMMFDSKVRFVGDRVAAVAAENEQVADEALRLIRVDYAPIPEIISPDDAIAAGAPVIHDERDARGIHDARHNIAASVDIATGDVGAGFSESDVVVETTCETQYAQHVPLEPHVCLSWLDEDGRLVIRTSTQVPFHVRRIVAHVLNLPVGKIRVIKPRIGGAFGTKQEIVLEDLAGLFTLRTGRPVLLELTRKEEFVSSRTRHPMRVRVKLGAKKNGTLHAIEMEALSNTGAYGTHGLTVLSNVGSKTLPLYNKADNVHFFGKAVYTNLPVAGAYRGYGAPQGYFPLETAMDELAERLGIDPLVLRRRNHIQTGETSPIFERLGEGREGVAQTIKSCALDRCIEAGAERIGWTDKRGKRHMEGKTAYGIGMSIHMQGSGIPYIDMGAATIKMNEDGSFNLLLGATDLGTGSDTILAQIAAEVLGVPLSKMIVYSSDTDRTPFDVGAYASSTTYVSGQAVEQAAKKIRGQIISVASAMLGEDMEGLILADEHVIGEGKSVSLAEVCRHALYESDQFQPAATASYFPRETAPPFMASFAEVAVDTETGAVGVVRYVAAVDCGTAINPRLAEGQVEGAVVNGIGYALTEEMLLSKHGRVQNPSLFDYKIPCALDIPPIDVILVESHEPTGPMGAKSIAEIGINAPIPTIANAVYDAVGIRLSKTPFTPERVLQAIRKAK
ncbi:MAG: molybdopterin cofactor-binding domain-containing protein [Candidatus Bipolaricaulota bacterium]|nr:molybdopterin cofactor-binding domain-containing protein [Candidatus Bipolaricaulota bacterium]